MKLELFDFIDDTLLLIEKKEDMLKDISKKLEKFFNDSLYIKDHFLNANYRIKSKESLREKILRNNFYMKYESPENLLDNLSDLLGIMENAPLLYITTVAYNQNDIPFEYSLASYRADMYKMNVDLYKDKFYK